MTKSNVRKAGAGSLKEAAPDEKGATRRRILVMARTRFNQSGVQGTAVFKIAADLGMSVGNLNYHFKNKSEIVLALSEAFRESVEEIMLGLKPPLRAEEVVERLETVLRTLWNYRFLFNSAIHVSQLDSRLASQVKELQHFMCDILERYFEATIRRGEMRRPRQDDGVTLLSENILSVWLQWLRAKNIEHPDRAEADTASLYECMRRHYSLIDPYVSRAFSDASLGEVKRKFGPRLRPVKH